LDSCPACGAGWEAIDVSHGPACPRHLIEEAFDTPNGVLVRRCFRLLNAKAMGLTITLEDITEEELRVMELIEAERQEQVADEDNDAKSFQELAVQNVGDIPPGLETAAPGRLASTRAVPSGRPAFQSDLGQAGGGASPRSPGSGGPSTPARRPARACADHPCP